MKLFNFKKNSKKNDKKESKKNNDYIQSESEKYITNLVQSGMNAENAIIVYILLESQKNNISLAQKDDITYINFRNEKIRDFLKDWYTLLKAYQHKKISDKVYQMYIDSLLSENKSNGLENKQTNNTSEENFDDFFDIFNDTKE